MTLEQLKHLLRASADVLRARGATHPQGELVVIGSQSILGQYPDAPLALLRSMEADIYPLHDPGLADYIDGVLGEGSPFHDMYGYYAQGVGPGTAVLPEGWESRSIRVMSPAAIPAIGVCLEAHDLAISKYVAGREKDLEFNRELARNGMTQYSTLLDRLTSTDLSNELRKVVRMRIELHSRYMK